MWSIALNGGWGAALVSALAFWVATPATAGEPQPAVLKEPVFGLRYKPAEVRYPAADPALLRRCPDLENARWSRRLWVHARVHENGTEFIAVGGYFLSNSPGRRNQTWLDDPNGAMLALDASGCRLIGPVRETLDSPPPELSKTASQALVADAVARAEQAFGGSDALRAALRAQRRWPASERSPMLAGALAPR